jgi:enoyl-CoA hydratase/carnithine racemase
MAKWNIGHREIQRELWNCSKPIITAVHGFVGPEATRLTAGTDLIIAAEGTDFSFEQLRAGGVPAWPLLTFLLGEKKMKEWTLLGGRLSAEEAERHGLVNKVVPATELISTAREWAMKIAAIPPQNVRANKTYINEIVESQGLWHLVNLGRLLGSAGHGSDVDKSFFQTVMEKGLKPALEVRDQEHGGRQVGSAGGRW